MDSEAFAIGIVAVSAAAAFISWVVANAVARLREAQTRQLPTDLEARLARIEAAVEAIAIEVERAGELQRFTAKLSQSTAPSEPARIARPVTPG